MIGGGALDPSASRGIAGRGSGTPSGLLLMHSLPHPTLRTGCPTKEKLGYWTLAEMYARSGSAKKPFTISAADCSRATARSTPFRSSSLLRAAILPTRSCLMFFHTHSSGLSSGEYGGRKNSLRRSLLSATNWRVILAVCALCPVDDQESLPGN